jgi:hypothetical protein
MEKVVGYDTMMALALGCDARFGREKITHDQGPR